MVLAASDVRQPLQPQGPSEYEKIVGLYMPGGGGKRKLYGILSSLPVSPHAIEDILRRQGGVGA